MFSKASVYLRELVSYKGDIDFATEFADSLIGRISPLTLSEIDAVSTVPTDPSPETSRVTLWDGRLLTPSAAAPNVLNTNHFWLPEPDLMALSAIAIGASIMKTTEASSLAPKDNPQWLDNHLMTHPIMYFLAKATVTDMLYSMLGGSIALLSNTSVGLNSFPNITRFQDSWYMPSQDDYESKNFTAIRYSDIHIPFAAWSKSICGIEMNTNMDGVNMLGHRMVGSNILASITYNSATYLEMIPVLLPRLWKTMWMINIPMVLQTWPVPGNGAYFYTETSDSWKRFAAGIGIFLLPTSEKRFEGLETYTNPSLTDRECYNATLSWQLGAKQFNATLEDRTATGAPFVPTQMFPVARRVLFPNVPGYAVYRPTCVASIATHFLSGYDEWGSSLLIGWHETDPMYIPVRQNLVGQLPIRLPTISSMSKPSVPLLRFGTSDGKSSLDWLMRPSSSDTKEPLNSDGPPASGVGDKLPAQSSAPLQSGSVLLTEGLSQ
jgi:hypothetical protein